ALLSNPPPQGQEWPMKEVTVGQYARMAIDFYVNASAELDQLRQSASLRYDDPADLAKRLRAFAAARDPQLNTCSLVFAMARATGGGAALRSERQARVQAVNDRLQRVPMPRRFFVALLVGVDRLHDERYPADYLLTLARQVPREIRIKTLKGQKAIEDPDLKA